MIKMELDNKEVFSKHAKEKHECLLCGLSFSDKTLLTEHTKMCSNSKLKIVVEKITMFTCGECGDKFHRKSSLLQHLKDHRENNKLIPESSLPKLVNCGPRIFECDICDRLFSESVFLKLHMRIHQGHKPYKCSTCGYRFDSCYRLQKHSSEHLGKVQKSSKGPNGKETERIHSRENDSAETSKLNETTEISNADQKSSKSSDCVSTMNDSNSSKPDNISKKKQMNRPTFKCESCWRNFQTKTQMNAHKCLDSYPCNLCNTTLPDRLAYKTHMRKVHGLKRSVMCSICKRGFRSLAVLQDHESSHTGARPFKCKQCGKGFTQRNSLYRHGFTHLETKNEKCQYCDKAFKQKEQLKVHLRIHLPAETVYCLFCGKGFRGKHYLRIHVKRCRYREKDTEMK